MMRNALLVLCVLSAVLTAGQGWCAGPAGHYLLSSMTIEDIRDGNYPCRYELQEILQYPEARKAFSGGAVGPDICEEVSHYGNTADLARKMIADAHAHYRTAEQNRDPAAFAEAEIELAFAYGWLSHCGADLNVHPKVNGMAGDTYRHCDNGQKLTHAAQEAQFTAYMKSVLGDKAPKYAPRVPYEFLSKHTGVPVDKLKAGMKTLNMKVIAELGAANQVTVTDAMRNAWKPIVDGSLADTKTFIGNPESMGNWDLDCGRISTMEFDELRALAIKANGGKLPDSWGKNYMDWYQQTKGLTNDQKLARLRQLVKGTSSGFAGTWKTNWGTMTLTVSGSSVSGNYPHDKGKIEGTVSADGRTLNGKWLEAPSYSFPKDGGRVILNLSADGKSFSGTWGYGEKTTGGSWTGTRIE